MQRREEDTPPSPCRSPLLSPPPQEMIRSPKWLGAHLSTRLCFSISLSLFLLCVRFFFVLCAREHSESQFSLCRYRAHCSTGVAGGPHNAILDAIRIKANAVAIFTRNQRTWKASPLAPEVEPLASESMRSIQLLDTSARSQRPSKRP